MTALGMLCCAATLLAQAPTPPLPRIFVVGDSTAKNGERRGWGDSLAGYFDPAKVTVVNRARGGRSSRTFQSEGLWDQVLAELRPGDLVLLQFGHNDAGPLDAGRARGSLPGVGEETQETVHTYGSYMRKYIADAKAKGATPIVLSPTVRNIWKDGKVERRGPGSFGEWAAEVAQAARVAFVDLTTIVADRYDKMGAEKVREFFPLDHTHTSEAGADFNAAAVVSGLKRLPNTPFTAFLSAKGLLPEPANPNLPSLFLIGDSTVRNGRGDGRNGQWGWGEPIAAYFDSAKINVVNRALGGLSSRTYLTLFYWDKVLAMLKPGDVVIMQFGHNDSGPVNDTSRARGTLKGIGEETVEIDNLLTKKREVVHTYGWYLRQFIAGARANGATPIVCSLVPRKLWKDGELVREDYANWAAEVARTEQAAFIDLNAIVARRYEELGPETVSTLFADERTHTTLAGAELNAASVIAGLKSLDPNSLAPFFSEKGK